MKKAIRSLVRKALRDQRGQTLPFVALAMTGLMSVAGLVVDVGHAYVVRSQIQNSANAAALAAAGLVYNQQSQTVNTTTQADKFGATGIENPNPYIVGPPVVNLVCVSSLMPKGTSCVNSGPNQSPKNAVQVTQTAKVPTFLMAMVGIRNLTVSATATASMRGTSVPLNLAVIVDGTGSMAQTDSSCGSLTQFQCALSGVQALLELGDPCPSGVSTCSGSTSNIRVSLFTFPNVLTAVNGALPVVNGSPADSISDEIACGSSPATWNTYTRQPIAAPYTLPVPGATLSTYTSGNAPSTYDVGLTYLRYSNTVGSTTKTWDATYQITPFLSDYYNSSDSSGLSSSSNLVKAVGYGNTSGCLTYTFGIWGVGSGSGFGNTYTASAIYAAQAALNAEQASYGGQNAIILLSDGGMNASYYSENKNAYGSADNNNQFAKAYEFPSGPAGSEVGPTHTSPNYPVPSYYTPATSSDSTKSYDTLGVNGQGNYPDWYDQCQQTMQAGQYATNHSTTVFAVAYGASSTSGCSSGWNVGATDTTTLSGVSDVNASFTLSSLTPCIEMENVASNLNDFYSDYYQGGTSTNCIDGAHVSSLSQGGLQAIFQSILTKYLSPQLLPNNAQ